MSTEPSSNDDVPVPVQGKSAVESVKDFIGSQRLNNILKGIISMMLILGVFFLGYDAANWTNAQIKDYCNDYNAALCFQLSQNLSQPNASVNLTGVYMNYTTTTTISI